MPNWPALWARLWPKGEGGGVARCPQTPIDMAKREMIPDVTPDGGDCESFELVLEPRTDRFDAADERWLEQVSSLYRALQRELGNVTRRHEPVLGTKGGAEVVIMALGSAGAFTASLEMLRAWLGRDRSRRLDISYTIDNRTETVSIAGDGIDKDAMAKIAGAVATRLGDAPWTDTAPS